MRRLRAERQNQFQPIKQMDDNLLSFETKGRIIAIDEPQTFPSGFTKREFVISVPDGKYPQDIKFEMHKDRADVLTLLAKGDEVTVGFNLRGNEYNGKYYVNLVAWKAILESKGQDTAKSPATDPTDAGDDDEIPF